MNFFRTCSHHSIFNRHAVIHKRFFTQTSKLYFYEIDDKGGPEYKRYINTPWQELLKEGVIAFNQESKKLWQEIKDNFQQDRKLYRQGDTDVFFRFDSEDCLKEWMVGSDKRNNEGNSDCKFFINDNKKAVFQGNIDMTPPKDGKRSFSGYCGIKSAKKKKAFYREDTYPFEHFTHLEMRVKGDGRAYALNLGILAYYDVAWYMTYTFSLFTHGGPYWQLVRIPLSKFFLTSKGRIQDYQSPVPKHKINSIGITCAGVAGPFKLEIDYIGAHVDFTHTEEFAYEMYNVPKEFVST